MQEQLKSLFFALPPYVEDIKCCKRDLQYSLWRPNSMILPLVRLLRKLTYLAESRRLAKKANPVAKARIWTQIGVLQIPRNISYFNFILFGGSMKLQTVKRTAGKKSEVNKLRREGYIPAVLYVKEKSGETFAVKANEFSSFLRHVKPGHLPTSIFTLVDEKGKERKVVIKDIQYEITTYDVAHLDFEELLSDYKINVKVPIECIGQADCMGIKLGGVLRQVIRHVRVRCLPKDLPTYFELDVRELGIKQTKRLSDLNIPNTVRPLADLHEVVAVIVKR